MANCDGRGAARERPLPDFHPPVDGKRLRLGEWLAQALRQFRNDVLLHRYIEARPPGLDAFLQQHRHVAGGRIGIVIAFEQPWALEWQLRMARRHLRDVELLVFDNSRQPAARVRIPEVCAANGVACLSLPPNRTRHVNRSHGMAMSWIYHNVVQVLRPEIFGFLDHDLIPVTPIRIADKLQSQPVFGLMNQGSGEYWSLWAGYCFYRHAFTAGKPLNFLYDFSRELDTGGRNWGPLYRQMDRARLQFASRNFIPLRPALGTEPRPVEIIDHAWVHMGGVGYNDNFEQKYAFFERLMRAFDAGAQWEDLASE